MDLQVIILAAGEGKRMRSACPKILHKLADVPLLKRVVETAQTLKPASTYVVYGHGGEIVQREMKALDVQWIKQEQRLGTGHAVQQALPQLNPQAIALVLFADVPLISTATLQQLLNKTSSESVSLLVAKVANPAGLGRVIRDQKGAVVAIVEDKDASEEQRQIQEIFSGIMAVPVSMLQAWLPRLNNNNAQGEYYLTEIPALAMAQGVQINSVEAENEFEIQGVNDKSQLAALERCFQQQQAKQFMQQGLMLRDPMRFDVRGRLEFGRDVDIDVNVIVEGQVALGNHTTVGANNVIRNSRIGDNVTIKENCVIEDAVIEDNCVIGPFARIRPGSYLEQEARVGNFVELKKSKIGRASKVPHLSYIGDSTVGCQVNIGAGTITCNYDGANKHQTIIGDQAFIGSGTQLVAPVNIGAGATIGAGSTITKNTPAGQLTLTRSKQTSIQGWQRPVKEEANKCVE